ncbi:MAG: hypothetical protein ACOCP4_06700 [Candidatus Woesearchaeota archaeon]
MEKENYRLTDDELKEIKGGLVKDHSAQNVEDDNVNDVFGCICTYNNMGVTNTNNEQACACNCV